MSKLSEVNMTDYERAMLAVLRSIRDSLNDMRVDMNEMRRSMINIECSLGSPDDHEPTGINARLYDIGSTLSDLVGKIPDFEEIDDYLDLSPEQEKELVNAELKKIHEGLSKH